ncbi:cyanophycin synthetase [Legionella quinlivanii]|uniref:Cyanophycin synthetase n=1 Tax=Legionella quinlivanii TaxID=45073 RepID=A0A364LHQ2_9GAMM|nr:cyanophycin synthetase [Legionella quinlivanii]RAP35776.1 cyanophycin synthetase [Legionella quinlivanii]
MDILNLRVLRGPNYWSNTRQKLIVMKLDLKEFEEFPSSAIPGFNDSLKQLLPSLYNHFCSESSEGGFFKRLDDGTWLGHVIEHVALELQWLAGMECGFGRTRSANEKGVYHVVFSYEIESAGLYAAKAAVELISTLAHQRPYTLVDHHLEQLKQIKQHEGFGPSTQSLVDEAAKRNIPYARLNDSSLIMLGHGCQQKLICATVTGLTSNIGVDNAADKERTKQLLMNDYIPVPRGIIIEDLSSLGQALEKVGYPCVIKPVDGNHGRGITTNICNQEKARAAFQLAAEISDRIIVEQFISGHDYRFLVINHKVIAVAKRTPAMIVGTGTATIQQLIDAVNQDPNRGEHHEKFLTTIKVDASTMAILAEKNLSLDSILPAGKVLYLKHTANLSTGGTAVDVTNIVHPQTIFIAERVSRVMHLDICGIDVVAENISVPLNGSNGAIIEVNAGPGFRMHLSPECGKARNVARPVIDMLFPAGSESRIPLVAITGTNGKTTTARLVAWFARKAGRHVGLTSTEGIYINEQEVYRGDCSGPFSARVVLRDPLVDYAVLECARGGILREGLGFDQSSISIVTNVSEDHLGLDEIHTLEELARVKEVVPRSTMKTGYAILNADDDLVYQMKNAVEASVALFSMQAANERIRTHCQEGGLAIYLSDGSIVLKEGNKEVTITHLSKIPLTFGGKASGMIQNVLPAVLAGYLSGFSLENIAAWLHEFQPNAENLPGRMNLFAFENYRILIDYGHNAAAFEHLEGYISQQPATRKIGIIAATGDRKMTDIRKIGTYAARMFDEIIIRHDKDGRGRSNEELTTLLLEGIEQAKDFESKEIKIISDEMDALQHVLHKAAPGSFIFYFPEDVMTGIAHIKKLQASAHATTLVAN